VDRVDAAEDTTVVLDLNRVSFVDVSGQRALLDACAVLAEQGSDVAVLRRGGQPDQLFELTHADAWLPLAN
jgi:anti-anti-sigma regulatory factor